MQCKSTAKACEGFGKAMEKHRESIGKAEIKFCRFALGRKGTIQTAAANVNSDGATCAPRDRLAPSRRIGGPECGPRAFLELLCPEGRIGGPKRTDAARSRNRFAPRGAPEAPSARSLNFCLGPGSDRPLRLPGDRSHTGVCPKGEPC